MKHEWRPFEPRRITMALLAATAAVWVKSRPILHAPPDASSFAVVGAGVLNFILAMTCAAAIWGGGFWLAGRLRKRR
jgi:hypothetical protein